MIAVVQDWERANFMELNYSKCTYTPSRDDPTPSDLVVPGGNTIKLCTNPVYLGVPMSMHGADLAAMGATNAWRAMASMMRVIHNRSMTTAWPLH